MSSTISAPVPSGWYPDPGGERQWRVWTGETWSSLTRPYGDSVVVPSLPGSLALVTALHRLLRYGIVALYAGLGLIVSVSAHWPGTARPISSMLASTLLDTGVAMLIMGSVAYALAGRALEGRVTPWNVTPVVNALAVSAFVTQRLNGRFMARRMVSEAVLLMLFVTQAHLFVWLGIAPTVIVLAESKSLDLLIQQLAGTSRAPESAP